MERNLTDADVEAIAKKISDHSVGHTCRFDRVKAEDLEEAIAFYKNFNQIVTEGKSTARKTLVAIVVSSAIGVTIIGALAKIKEAIIPK